MACTFRTKCFQNNVVLLFFFAACRAGEEVRAAPKGRGDRASSCPPPRALPKELRPHGADALTHTCASSRSHGRRQCEWCKSVEGGQRKTSYFCEECKLGFCNTQRSDGLSCFDLHVKHGLPVRARKRPRHSLWARQ